MKKIFVLLLWLPLFCGANTYYCSSNGLASNKGTIASPWSTTKLANFIPAKGDSVLFKAGDLFNTPVLVDWAKQSFVLFINKWEGVYLGKYGKGADPLFTSLQKVNSFTSLKGHIHQAALALEGKAVIVKIDGKLAPPARWPNNEWLRVDSVGAEHTLFNTALLMNNLNGAEAVVRKNHYIIDVSPIREYGRGKLSIANSTAYPIERHFSFFLQNHPQFLKLPGDWCEQNKLFSVYFNDAPAKHKVEIATLNTVAWVLSSSKLTIENLRFSDGNEYAVKVQNTRDIRFIRCSFSNSNTGLYGLNNIAGTAVIKCGVQNCYASGINLGDECPQFLLKENTVVNINTVPGAWRGGLAGTALEAVSDSGLIESNYITNCGYNAIGFRGNSVKIIKNIITNFCLIRHDGGAIYTFNANNLVVKDWLVANNIIQNGIGAGEGTPDPRWLPAQGIYADNNTNGGSIRDNRVTACNGAGIFIHNSYNLEIENNTLTGNATGIFFYQDGGIMRNHRLRNNRILPKPGQAGLKSKSIVGSTENFFKK